jgi:hypothetical protein
MMSVAAAAFTVAAVAFATQRGQLAFALGAAALSAAFLIADLGVAAGTTVALALWLTAASALVLVLSPRPSLARPIATACSVLGLIALGLGALP